MRKASALGFLILGLLAPTMFAQVEQQGGNSRGDNVLARRVEGADIEYLSTTNALLKALFHAGAPGGIVRTYGCEGDDVIHRWQPLGSSLRNVLDGIVNTDPKYRWSAENEVINAIPVAGEPELLRTHIREFKIQDAVWPGSTLSSLLSTQEVRASLDRLGLKEALKAGSFPVSSARKVGRTVQCHNVTLREALNVIARTFGNAVWFYKQDHCNGKDEYSIDFIVE